MAEMEKSDEELMNEYAANDDSRSFELLYHRYAGMVFGYLMNRVRDQAQCEEIHQNVFLKLHQVREQYRNDLPFAPWLFTIVRSAEETASSAILNISAHWYAEPFAVLFSCSLRPSLRGFF